ncbi:MAG: hypothetical protein SVR04_12075, partial [Spirochaetota bacterium]|nr:hypothetical protein [Spirochaetota bacterium]
LRGYLDSDSISNPGITWGLRISNREERAMERGNSGADLLLLWSGLVMIPPFILQPDMVLKAVQTALFLLYGVLLGKRVKVLPGIIIIVSVTAAAVLSPLGEVLLYAGGFPVTEGALFQGLTRGLNLVGMVYLSRCTISSRLKIPGKAGRLFYRVFFYFEELSSVRLEKSRSGGLMQAVREKLLHLDQRLLEWSTGSGSAGEVEGAGEVGSVGVQPAGLNDSGGTGDGDAGGSGGGTGAKTRLVRPWLPPAMVLIQYGFFFLQKFG